MKEVDRENLRGILRGVEGMEIKGISIDSRTIREGELFVALKGPRFDGHDYVAEAMKRGASGAMVERSVLEERYERLGGMHNIIPVEDTLLSLQEMAAMHRKKFTIPVVGITGSNGKTTTKEMLASIFRQRGPVLNNEGNLNNHIGVPLTLMKLDRTHRAAVIEMGMSALGEIELLARLARPDVGVITNIGPAHLEFLVTIDRIAQAKGELLEYMKPGGTAVLNADDPYFGALRAKFSGPAISFGIEQQADVSAADISQGKDYIDFTLRARDNSVPVRLRLVGRHNIYNALAAAAAAIAAEVMIDAVKDGLEAFVPRAMRSELKTIKGRVMLEDCYNANPRSMDAALETLVTLRHGRMTIAVLGDMLELGDAAVEAHRAIGRKAAALGVDLVISVGTLSSHIAEGARAGGMSPERVVSVKTNAEAAALLRERSQEGDAILIKGSRGMKMEKILEDF
ncbi:MAG: hypothetical protein A2X56_04935 [Nitrospirae bacterium GWC2_57_13]|jgi:UDP-N-acetylmuramoyl-tripeptide--D-alanyl-D-alanine ligase|nr:MAG: hypothetical protein A2X56_04935 [Nitrospirae bacterium GWC2_57_13]OGW45783.1 MAG: hypothetical protein A2X57_06825 [Nitrospirae bacterium GWD2_57_8]HAR46363.1 UDP-N-acetylmuramoyl-tripeptide--D-alanyl-D-alanine ligase [Nitrospiraceae bacterium]